MSSAQVEALISATPIVLDLDGNGIYDDAPDVVPDADGDGDVDRKDLRTLGTASEVRSVKFRVSGL